MRILHLLASPWWSGPMELVAALASAQRRAGHVVQVAIDRKREGGGAEEPAAPRLAELGLLDEGRLELSVKSTPQALLRDLMRLRAREVDLVHTHFTHDHLLARLGRPKGAALVRSVHAPRSARWSLPFAHGYTVPFEGLLQKFGQRLAMVLPPLLTDEFAPCPDPGALRRKLGVGGEPLIGMASTFQPSRRHLLALDAFALLRRQRPLARLLLLGDGALEKELRLRAAQPDLEGAVRFAGYLQGERFVEHLQALDQLWALGLGNDWSARVAAQARACGAAVVAVGEGALPTYADATVEELTPEAVAAAALLPHRRKGKVACPKEVLRALEALYVRARDRA